MKKDLTAKRCFNHHSREAVARCPECMRFFCRECVTEQNQKMICAGCLQKDIIKKKSSFHLGAFIKKSVGVSLGFIFLWCCFYYLGRILIAIPSSFHEGFLP